MSTDKAGEAGDALLKLVGILGVTAAMCVLRAATVTAFWRWYVVPTFHLPQLNLWTAFGCLLVAGMVTSSGLDQKETPSFGVVVGRSLAWLGTAWLLAGVLNLLK